MQLPEFRALLTPAGQTALQAAAALAPREQDFLRCLQILGKSLPQPIARAALETAILRREAATKFPHAEKMYFTREALEQSTAGEVSAYRAERYRPFGLVADLGCSIGGDTLKLAGVTRAIGLDRDPLRLAMAQANAAVLGLEVDWVMADLNDPLPLAGGRRMTDDCQPSTDDRQRTTANGIRNTKNEIPRALPTTHNPPPTALFFDPSRRAEHRRIFSVNDYRPPLGILRSWLPRFPAIGVKLSPGVRLEELVEYNAEIEFISLRGELKEAVLWFGALRTAQRRATLLPGAYTLISNSNSEIPNSKFPTSPPLAFLYEPDPAILRAGLVTTLAEQLDAAQLDPDIAYLTAEKITPTPFARAWEVEAWFPFQLKRLRAYLRQRGVGRVTVKKRGSPLTPEALIRDLRLSGEAERIIFLTHLRGEPIVVSTLNVELPAQSLSKGSTISKQG